MGWFSSDKEKFNRASKPYQQRPEWSTQAKKILITISLRSRASHYDVHEAAYTVYDQDEKLRFIEALCDEYDCDIHHQDLQGNTVLHAMSYALPSIGVSTGASLKKGVNNIAHLVGKKGVDITKKNHYGNTIFHDIVQRGDRLILNKGNEETDVNTVDSLLKLAKKDFFDSIQSMTNIDGNTLLHLAAAFGQPKTTELLLSKSGGVKYINIAKPINRTNKDDLTPLHYAILGVTQGHIKVAELLLQQKDIDNEHLITAWKMAQNLTEDKSIVARCIKQKLEDEFTNRELTNSLSGKPCPQLNLIHCTVSSSFSMFYPDPDWAPGIRCQQRKPKGLEEEKETKKDENNTNTKQESLWYRAMHKA